MEEIEVFHIPLLAWSDDGEVLLVRGYRIVDTWEPSAFLEILVEGDAVQRRPLTGELEYPDEKYYGDVYYAAEISTLQRHPFCVSDYSNLIQRFREFQVQQIDEIDEPASADVMYILDDEIKSKEFRLAQVTSNSAKGILTQFASLQLPLDFLLTQYTVARANYLVKRELDYRNTLERVITNSVPHAQKGASWSGKKILGQWLKPVEPEYEPDEYGVSPEEVNADKISLSAKRELERITRLDISPYIRRSEALWGEFDDEREEPQFSQLGRDSPYSFLKTVYLVNWASVYRWGNGHWIRCHGVASPFDLAFADLGEVSLRVLREDEIAEFMRRLDSSKNNF
jgi:hypothetical protein